MSDVEANGRVTIFWLPQATMHLLALVAATVIVSVAQGTDSTCNATLPWTVDREAHTSLTEDEFETLLRCPEDKHCCRNYTMEYAYMVEVTCSCARNCAIYGDCCWEAIVTDTDYATSKLRSSCMYVNIDNAPYKSIYMVTGCKSTWPQDEVLNGCQSPRNYTDPFYFIPVTSPVGITYYNGFCALCNYDIIDVTFWNASGFGGDSVARLHVPDALVGDGDIQLRECNSELGYVDMCNVTTNKEWVSKCETYFAPVYDSGHDTESVYKNVYCALCNGKEILSMTCAPRSFTYTLEQAARALFVPSLMQLLRPVTTQGDCLFSQGSRCYIRSAEYRFNDEPSVTLNSSDTNVTNLTSTEDDPVYKVQNYLTVICISISLVCIFLKAFVYVVYKSSRGFSSKCTLCLSLTLFFSHLLFLLANSFPLPEDVCMVSAMILHYGFLATFFWTSVLSFDIWKAVARTKTSRSGSGQIFARYCLMAWCVPVLLVLIGAIIDWCVPWSPVAPRYGQGSCWISSTGAQALFFLTPMALLIILNVSMYAHIIVHVRRTAKQAAGFEFRSGRQQSQMALFVKLAFIMGASWILGFLSAFLESDVTDVIVVVLIGLQGVYLFFGFSDYRYFFHSRKATERTTSGTSRTTQA